MSRATSRRAPHRGARRFPCECCSRNGIPHYRLLKEAEGYRNVLLCTACHKAGCDSKHDCLAYPKANLDRIGGTEDA